MSTWPRRPAGCRRSPTTASTSVPSPRDLEADGVSKFAASYRSLLAGIEAKAGALAAH